MLFKGKCVVKVKGKAKCVKKKKRKNKKSSARRTSRRLGSALVVSAPF